jgi:DNA-binding NarL/FixJ family response regulator
MPVERLDRPIPDRDAEMLRRAFDALDVGVAIFSPNLEQMLYQSARFRALVGDSLPDVLLEAIDGYVRARRDAQRPPPAMRLQLGDHAVYLRTARCAGEPPLEVVVVRQEVLRDADTFALLNSRYGVSRREFQVLSGLRLGKTNGQIATDFGLSPGTVARHVHRLLERFSVSNRTHLVNVVEQMVAKRG